MARKQTAAAETLGEIQDAADHLGNWIGEHLPLVVASVVALLLAVGGVSFYRSFRDGTELEASQALSSARYEYLRAMGAEPGTLEVPELANPRAAERIRTESVARYVAVADAHEGTSAAALARLEAARLEASGGDVAAALVLAEAALDQVPANGELRGLVLQRVAALLEDSGRWADAAARHEEAAAIESFPLRHWALADAARCAAEAGEPDRALALYQRVETEAPDLRLPDHQRAELRALETGAGSGS